MSRNTKTYSDIDFNFIAHPNTRDVSLKYDEEAVKQSIRNLILTRNYERPFRSDIGSQLNSLLFEPASPLLSAMMQKTIIDTINNYEPRADLLNVSVDFTTENNNAYVNIVFRIKNTQTPVSINLILERTR